MLGLEKLPPHLQILVGVVVALQGSAVLFWFRYLYQEVKEDKKLKQA
jgi:hypothetical protein